MLSRTLLASLLSVSALGAMPSGASPVFSTSSPTEHHAVSTTVSTTAPGAGAGAGERHETHGGRATSGAASARHRHGQTGR